MRKNKIDIISLGCSKNLVDSEHLIRQFQANGYSVEHNPSRVDGEIVVVNTCGFIRDAQEESIDMILELGRAKKEGKIKKLFVMGCLAERFMAQLIDELPEVDKFYGKLERNAQRPWQKLQGGPVERKIPHHSQALRISENIGRLQSLLRLLRHSFNHRPPQVGANGHAAQRGEVLGEPRREGI